MVVYSKDNCVGCVATKTFLENNEVVYEERNVEHNPEFMEELRTMGYSSLPITITDEGKEIVGFDMLELQGVIK